MIKFMRVVEKYQNQASDWQARALYQDEETGNEFCALLHFRENLSAAVIEALSALRAKRLSRIKEETAVDKAELAKIPERTKRPVISTPEGGSRGDIIR